MIVTATPISAKADFLQGVHQPTDVYKLALYTDKSKLDANSTVYVTAGEVKAEGYEAGGKELSGYVVKIDEGKAVLSFDTATWEDVSITARGGVIYNASKENRLIAIFDFGMNKTSTDDRFRAAMPPVTAKEGLIRFN